jgi:hypothetical protein
MVTAAGINGKLSKREIVCPLGMANHVGKLIKITRITAAASHNTCWRTVSEPRMNLTIRLATEAKMIKLVVTDTIRSVVSHHGATRNDDAPYSGVGPTNMLPRSAFPTVSQHSTAQRRLSGFPVGKSCKINGRQQKTPRTRKTRRP